MQLLVIMGFHQFGNYEFPLAILGFYCVLWVSLTKMGFHLRLSVFNVDYGFL